jgi:integrase/recombinase XerD
VLSGDQTAQAEVSKIWTGQRGPLTGSAVYKSLKNYAFRAGLDPDLVSAHVLRHTCATFYLQKNPGDLRGLAAILGHRSLDTVMVYTEPTIEELTRRMEG